MDIKLKKYSDIYIIEINGEIDLYNSHKLKDIIDKMQANNVFKYAINFENVNYIDSSGIGTIISIYSTLKDKNHKIWLYNIHGSVKKVIELTKLDGFLPIAENLQEVINNINN